MLMLALTINDLLLKREFVHRNSLQLKIKNFLVKKEYISRKYLLLGLLPSYKAVKCKDRIINGFPT